MNYESNESEPKLNWKFFKKWTKTKLKVRYKFVINHGWSFKWMNSIALTFMIVVLKTTCKNKKKEGIPFRETQAKNNNGQERNINSKGG